MIDYVTDPEKTYNAGYENGEQKYFVTTMNCNATCAKRQFQNVKKQFSKTSGIIAYHGYQSFAPGEVSAQEAHRIGVELAEQLWAGRFQVIVSTNVNTGCIHNHLLFNSVSFRDGKKYHDCREAYRKMREMILSRLVDTFFSRISLTMPLPPKFHNTAYVLLWEEDLHWQSRSSGCSSS